MEIIGKFEKIVSERSGEGKNGEWKAVSFIITAKERIFAFDAFNAVVNTVSQANPGDKVKLDFKIRCREYKEKYYTTLEVESFEILERATRTSEKNDDGLPF